jgi:hypothetical protein
MNRRRYTEDQSVQKPAAELLASLGWHSVVAYNAEDFGPGCRRRLNIEPPCRFNIEPGRVAGF